MLIYVTLSVVYPQYWWRPDSLINSYRGSEFEFVPVNLPPSSRECIDNLVTIEERCSDDYSVQVGSLEGACDTGPVDYFMLSTGMFKQILNVADIQNDLTGCSEQSNSVTISMTAHVVLHIRALKITKYPGLIMTNGIGIWMEHLMVIPERQCANGLSKI